MATGHVTDLGKFEGEPFYVMMFWPLGLEGLATREVEDAAGIWYEFDIDQTDIDAWPELADVKTLRIRERNDGFVVHENVKKA